MKETQIKGDYKTFSYVGETQKKFGNAATGTRYTHVGGHYFVKKTDTQKQTHQQNSSNFNW